MPDPTFVRSSKVAVAGTPIHFQITVLRDQNAFSLLGKTVQATIRAVASPDVVINAALENFDIGNNAIADFTVNATNSAFLTPLCPPDRRSTAEFSVALYDVTDNYRPQLFFFPCRRP